MNLAYRLYQVSNKIKDEIALIEDGQKISYAELWKKIDRFGDGLLESGIKEGDNVVIILPSSAAFIISFFALLKINAIAVPLEPIFTTDEYKEMFAESSPKALITSSYITVKVLGYEKSLLEEKMVIITDTDPWVKEKYPGSLNFEDIYKLGKSGKAARMDSAENQIASINYTYRGYGYPVGAVLTHENYLSCVNGFSNYITDNRVFLSILPVAHIFALICGAVVPLLHGATNVIVKSNSARQIFRTIAEYQVDYMIGVPTLYLYLMKSYDKTKYDLSSLNYCISGGNSLPCELHKQIEQTMGIKIFQGYGLTEGLIISCNPKSKNKPGSLGLSGNGIQVKIVNESGEDVGIDKKGEILIKGANVMAGFYKRETETEEVLKHGWLYTGDYGKIDNEGYLYFEGLKKNIAKVGGHSVDLLEIEKVLLTHPCISKVKAYTEADELWGERVGVKLTLGKSITREEVNAFCSGKFCTYKIPKIINFD